jgi:hypothetical protein
VKHSKQTRLKITSVLSPYPRLRKKAYKSAELRRLPAYATAGKSF